ncbi:hypothetical protein PR202_ga15885 [Eleusine coracana subsp. coracana]|uniref:Uncharacterized protein n=1 Tax=Eleusine coracana subsp. coracana TaxID=191504 RepID=A0AAV5CL17_ELECO|nr:hypothetical protein PR202_ga15885 [Eleusine coracana subsp. coracana]
MSSLLRLQLSMDRRWARPDMSAPLWKMEDKRGARGGQDDISATSGSYPQEIHDTTAEGLESSGRDLTRSQPGVSFLFFSFLRLSTCTMFDWMK